MPRGVVSTASAAAARLRTKLDADALHAAALVDLVLIDTSGKAIDRSISYLEMLTRLFPVAPSPLVDLSAAYLAAASRGRDASFVLRAADAASRALSLDARSAAARYNRALSLDLLGLDEEAARDWRRYLDVDSTSGWSIRARRQLTAMDARHVISKPSVSAPADSIVTFALTSPLAARSFVWQDMFAAWADAVTSGDDGLAATRLASTSAVAAALLGRFGDAALTEAIKDIGEAKQAPADRRRLAHLHARFSWGLARTAAHDHRAADSAYLDVLHGHPPKTLRAWATYGHANAVLYAGNIREAIRLGESLLAQVERRRDPSLVGRTAWMVGIARLRLGQNDSGLAFVRRARRAFEAAGESENVYASWGVEGEVSFRSRNDALGYSYTLRALRGLRAFPTSTWRHNVLLVFGREASLSGYGFAASAIEDEDAAMESAAGRPATSAEARLARARGLWTSGNVTFARRVTDAAANAIDSLPFADARQQLRADLNFTRAMGPLRTQPREARTVLDSVVAFYGRGNNVVKLVPALVARAKARVALKEGDSAEADLLRAASLYHVRTNVLAGSTQEVALRDEVGQLFDVLVTLRVSRGQYVEALDALEDGRALLSHFAAAHPDGEGRRVNRTGLTLDYAFIGDTVFTWTIDSGGVQFHRMPLRRSEAQQALERLRANLELRAGNGAHDDLAQFYEWLVRPFENRLGVAGRPLTIIADGAIASVPFAALFDSRSKRYLVESHPVRWGARLVDTPIQRGSVSPRALFIGDPAPGSVISLPALTGAVGEARRDAALYPGAVLLTGVAADSAAVTRALAGANLFHFAGHAVFDDARPERSRLVMGPHDLDARAIASLDLTRLRLVVLSACETMRTPDRQGGFAGLTDAFLAAGAGGVVGSLWRVGDTETAALMRVFHEHYAKNADPTEALAAAQRDLLRSPEADLRSPIAWGAFRYAGR